MNEKVREDFEVTAQLELFLEGPIGTSFELVDKPVAVNSEVGNFRLLPASIPIDLQQKLLPLVRRVVQNDKIESQAFELDRRAGVEGSLDAFRGLNLLLA